MEATTSCWAFEVPVDVYSFAPTRFNYPTAMIVRKISSKATCSGFYEVLFCRNSSTQVSRFVIMHPAFYRKILSVCLQLLPGYRPSSRGLELNFWITALQPQTS